MVDIEWIIMSKISTNFVNPLENGIILLLGKNAIIFIKCLSDTPCGHVLSVLQTSEKRNLIYVIFFSYILFAIFIVAPDSQ